MPPRHDPPFDSPRVTPITTTTVVQVQEEAQPDESPQPAGGASAGEHAVDIRHGPPATPSAMSTTIAAWSSSAITLPGSALRIVTRSPLFERVSQFAYIHSLWVHAVIAVLVCACCRIFDSRVLAVNTMVTNPLLSLLVLICLVEVLLLVVSHVALLREVSTIEHVRPWSIWNMYMSVMVTYATIYFTLFCMSRGAFDLQGYAPDVKSPSDGNNASTDQGSTIIDDGGGPGELSDLSTYNDPVAVYVFFLYFSSAIITSTGFGDIIPGAVHSQMLTNMEMLVGLIYHAGVFGFALDHFMRLKKKKSAAEQAEKKRMMAAEQLARDRDALLVSIRDDSIVRDPAPAHPILTANSSESAAAASASPNPIHSPVTPGNDLPHHVRLTSPHPHGRSSSVVSDGALSGSSTPPSPASEDSSPGVTTRVTLSGLTSPASSVHAADADGLMDLNPLGGHDHEDDLDQEELLDLDECPPALLRADSPLYGDEIGMRAPARQTTPRTTAAPFPSSSSQPPSSPASSSATSSSRPSSIRFLPRLSSSALVHTAAAAAAAPTVVPSTSRRSSKKPPSTFFGQFSVWRRLKSNPQFERARRWVIEYLLGIELLLQMVSSSLMFTLTDPFTGLADATGSNLVGKVVVLVFASLLLVLQLALNGGVSLRLMNKIAGSSFTEVSNERGEVIARIPKEGVTASFLTQSYMSTVLVFASIYFFLFAFSPSHEFSRARSFDLTVVDVWFTFMYFSVTVMTGCGFGDLYARGVLSRIVALFQMLISIVYACIIIGLGMLVMCEQLERKAQVDLQAKEHQLAKLLRVVAEEKKRASQTNSSTASTLGSPSGQVVTADIEPPLLELIQKSDLLRKLSPEIKQ